jgi:hypothetical protein
MKKTLWVTCALIAATSCAAAKTSAATTTAASTTTVAQVMATATLSTTEASTTTAADTTTATPTTTAMRRMGLLEAGGLYLANTRKANEIMDTIQQHYDSDGDGVVTGRADLILWCQDNQKLERAEVDFESTTPWPIEAKPLFDRLVVEDATVVESFDTSGGRTPCSPDRAALKRRFAIGTEIRVLFGLPINR